MGKPVSGIWAVNSPSGKAMVIVSNASIGVFPSTANSSGFPSVFVSVKISSGIFASTYTVAFLAPVSVWSANMSVCKTQFVLPFAKYRYPWKASLPPLPGSKYSPSGPNRKICTLLILRSSPFFTSVPLVTTRPILAATHCKEISPSFRATSEPGNSSSIHPDNATATNPQSQFRHPRNIKFLFIAIPF